MSGQPPYIVDESTDNRDYAYPTSGVEMSESKSRCVVCGRVPVQSAIGPICAHGPVNDMEADLAILRKRMGEFEEGHSIASIGQLREAVTALTERIEKLERGSMTGTVQGSGTTYTVTAWPSFDELMDDWADD